VIKINERIKKERDSMITAFFQHLKKIPDNRDEWPIMREFLYESVQNHNGATPIVEFITVLRHKKPVIYQKLIETSLPNSIFYPLIQIEIPLNVALNHLEHSID
jgi:hypothetical protein